MGNYEVLKQKAREREAEIVRKGQDVAPIPPVLHPRRKKKAIQSFRAFCDSYFKEVFFLPWSEIHVAVAAKIERVVRNGEIFAVAMPRGSGKTTLCLVAVLWAILSGRASFVALVAASAERALALLEDLKTWIETNDLLFEDFPEVCHPVRKLERITHRQKGQKFNGESTRIEWGAKKIVFPTIPGSKASGAVVQCSGMGGSQIRGISYVRPDGKRARPDLCIIDDPQTRESAQSVKQCEDREKIIKADVLGMAGPGKKIAALCACTVVAPDDLAERLLDRKRNPDFRGERYKLLVQYPENMRLWEEYRQIRAEELINDGDGAKATAFYKEHREEMDQGAAASWESRYNADEISAVQHAMNLMFRDEDAFKSEYQNEAENEDVKAETLDAQALAAKCNALSQGTAPDYAARAAAYIDVHKDLLYYVVLCFADDFTASVVDYGTYPKQKKRVFKLSSASPTLSDIFKNAGLEGALYAGLSALVDDLAGAEYPREGTEAAPLTIEKILVDANWGASTEIVYQFCKESKHSRIMLPAHGQYVGASSRPFSDYSRKVGDRVGPHWRIPGKSPRKARHVLIDANYWKSFLYARLSTAIGDSASLSFNGKASLHTNIFSHILAEEAVAVEAKGRRVDEWKVKPNKDNHWLDCLAGCCVAASICGAAIPAVGGAVENKKTRISFADLAKERRRGK